MKLINTLCSVAPLLLGVTSVGAVLRSFSLRSSVNVPYGRILKANFSWSPTWAKFCQIIHYFTAA